MNLNKNLKQKIVIQFKAGESMQTIAQWYGKSLYQIEQVVRDYLLEQHRVELERERVIGDGSGV